MKDVSVFLYMINIAVFQVYKDKTKGKSYAGWHKNILNFF